ncbi:tonsoku-like protein, partial [Phaenicophaeus curvirostris]|uniref:tonsoku-like protein n=1 Tax=Phaenicophaeus curvirostris TaxID=33595 RepID=UPI0037F0CCD0
EEEEELEGYSKSGPGRRRVSKWERRNERGETPLHRACIEGDLRRVQLFLKQGHPVNPRDYCGWTPLHEACNHGHLEVVVALLGAGAALDDAGGPGCEGVTPLHDALACGHFEVAEVLVRRGASLRARNSAGLTPLGTLRDWIRTYGPELDEETWQRCRAAERLLLEAAAAAPSAQGPSDPLFDAELSEPASAPEQPGKKRQRDKDGEEEEDEDAIRNLGNTKSLFGGSDSDLDGAKSQLGGSKSNFIGFKSNLDGSKSNFVGSKSNLDGSKSNLDGSKSRLGGSKSNLGGSKSLLEDFESNFDGSKSFFDGTKSNLGGARSFLGGSKSLLGGSKSDFDGSKSNFGGSKSFFDDTKSLGGTKSNLGGTKSFLGGSKSLLRGSKSNFDGSKSQLGASKSFLGGSKSNFDASKSDFDASKSLLDASESVSGAAAASCRQPALIPEEQYLAQEDWLEDDLGSCRGSWKRPRRESRERRDAAMASRDEPELEITGTRHPPRRRRRSRLSMRRIPTGRSRQRRMPERECQTPCPSESDTEGTPEPAVTPNPTATPPAIPTLRVRVRIQDSVFLIPVPQSEPCAVGWLAARAAERYQQALGLLPRLTLKKEGALLAPQDAVRDVLRSNEEVLAEVQGWDLPPLAERYRRACRSLDVEPHRLLLKVTELQEQSPELGFGAGLGVPAPHLPPLLRALKLQASLRRLRLRACGLSDALAPELLAAVATLPALALLDLAGNRLGAGGLRSLLPAEPGAHGAFQSLEELDLSLNPLGDAACRPLARLLQACPALTTLRIEACGFSEAFDLPGASRLNSLALSRNSLGSPALERLLGSVSRRSLSRLELGAVVLPGSSSLASTLRKFLQGEGNVLGHLTLAGNRLQDRDVLEIARSLPRCPSLVSLDLSANPGITSEGLRMLLSALAQRNEGLQLLNLAGCSVEGPSDASTWSETFSKIHDFRLCGRRVRRSHQGDAFSELGIITRHHKLFWKKL